jgi:hypothetical protein
MILYGCSAPLVKRPSTTPDGVKAGNQAIVLLRLDTLAFGESNDPLSFGSTDFSLADIDLGEPMKTVQPYKLYLNATDAGWQYLILKPGRYYLWVKPSYSAPEYHRFRLNVPSGSNVIYAGTIRTSCRSYDSCPEASIVVNELASAKLVATTVFRDFAELSTVSLASSYGMLYKSIGAASPNALFPLALVIASGGAATGTAPEYTTRTFEQAHAPLKIFSGGGSGPGVGSIGAFYLMYYLPVAALSSALIGTWKASKWKTCFEDLTAKPLEHDPTHEIATRLTEELTDFGIIERINVSVREDAYEIVQTRKFVSLLWADFELVELRECGTTNTFCLDIGIRVRLFDASNRDLLYEKLFVHSSSGIAWRSLKWRSLPNLAGHNPLVSESSECRELDDYCGEKGRKMMKVELSKAINTTVTAVMKDFQSLVGKP